MFYPQASLRRGGKFYICWLADSWPSRFARITPVQLWAHDVRKLCDDLREVITNESGRPSNRFSLRLSSKLMRGLLRLYKKKVNLLLADLCMIHATVFNLTNKKLRVTQVVPRVRRPVQRERQLPAIEPEKEPEPEQRVEELLQNSGNVVANIQDITLKEATIPDFHLPKNDGFGEEHPEQALQLFPELGERSVEQILAPRDVTAPHLSALGLLDVTDKSHDKSRLVLHHSHAMETMQEQDVSLFRKSAGDGPLSTSTFEKDIPEIPEIPQPEPSAPKQPEKEPEQAPPQELEEIAQPVVAEPQPPAETGRVPQTIELEELEEQPQAQARRRRPKKLIVDKKTMLSKEFLRARIGNPKLELRCEDSSDDVIPVYTPWAVLRSRPARAGCTPHPKMAAALIRMFMRNLHPATAKDDAFWTDRRVEETIAPEPTRRTARVSRSSRTQVLEVGEQQNQSAALPQPEPSTIPEIEVSAPPAEQQEFVSMDITVPPPLSETELLKDKDASAEKEQMMDISELPTQKLRSLSQEQRERELEVSPPKRLRLEEKLAAEPEDVDKENVPPKSALQQPPARDASMRELNTLLQEAGLTQIQSRLQELVPPVPEPQLQMTVRKDRSDGSETPLGSLDRTKVSLGESVESTSTQRFIREHWGAEGTMVKIMNNIRADNRPITVWTLVARGPQVEGKKNLIAATCFGSILKLLQHGFIRVEKVEGTNDIKDITLGRRFDRVRDEHG